MNFTIKREVLLDGLQKTLGIVEKKTTLPILSNILLEAEDGLIKVVATDREISLVARYEASVTEAGKTTLSAKKLYEIVREIWGEEVHVSMDSRNIVTLTCQKTVYRIMGISADDYPSVVAEENIPLYPVSGNLLKEMVRKVYSAMSTDELRRNLNGIFLQIEKNSEGVTIRMVSTDGHRLSMVHKNLDATEFLDVPAGVILPRKGIGEIRKLVESDPEHVSIGLMGQMFIVRTTNVMLKVSLVNAEYPDYKRVIPTETGTVLFLPRDDFLHALRRMWVVVSSEEFRTVLLTIYENRMVLQSQHADVGEAREEIDVSYDGEKLEVGYNADYLMDAIEVVDGETIAFELGSGRKPGIVRSAGQDDYSCVVMPLII
ncbi:MAG: DNA polymerase III subunit beta [Deltaproteobacteria bacterium]|jgi:DNA polymerase-3 subunit beta|nr:DNA polymerase III subunit beta [Deltaproteobacteria bacterium]